MERLDRINGKKRKVDRVPTGLERTDRPPGREQKNPKPVKQHVWVVDASAGGISGSKPQPGERGLGAKSRPLHFMEGGSRTSARRDVCYTLNPKP